MIFRELKSATGKFLNWSLPKSFPLGPLVDRLFHFGLAGTAWFAGSSNAAGFSGDGLHRLYPSDLAMSEC